MSREGRHGGRVLMRLVTLNPPSERRVLLLFPVFRYCGTPLDEMRPRPFRVGHPPSFLLMISVLHPEVALLGDSRSVEVDSGDKPSYGPSMLCNGA